MLKCLVFICASQSYRSPWGTQLRGDEGGWRCEETLDDPEIKGSVRIISGGFPIIAFHFTILLFQICLSQMEEQQRKNNKVFNI